LGVELEEVEAELEAAAVVDALGEELSAGMGPTAGAAFGAWHISHTLRSESFMYVHLLQLHSAMRPLD